LDAIIVNPSIIFGPANWGTGSPKMFKTIWDGLKFYTKGITGFVDVRDVVKAMILLMEESNFETAKNQRYLLNSEDLSYQNIFFQIADALEKPRPKYFASDLLLKFVWRGAKLASLIAGKPAMITRETVANSNTVYKFDGSKITRHFNFEYHPISETIKQTASFLKKDLE
jgi:nucleoside-diphosphate-sugar epimerase